MDCMAMDGQPASAARLKHSKDDRAGCRDAPIEQCKDQLACCTPLHLALHLNAEQSVVGNK